MTREFHGWPKISRFEAERVQVTEKLDGSNAAVVITEDDIYAQSRTRIITPDADNFGFARWVEDNAETLREDLGVGRHYGEWYGAGIQRKYGLDHRRFALFNTLRFEGADGHFTTPRLGVVPLLYSGPFESNEIHLQHSLLMHRGSVAVPGWDKPEGIVVFAWYSKAMWKITDAVQGAKHS